MKKFNAAITKHYILFFNLYFISIFLKSTTLVVDYPILNTIQKTIRIIAFLFMLIRLILVILEYYNKIIGKKWKDKTKLEKIILVTLGTLLIAEIINFALYRDIRLLSITLVILSSYKVETKKIMKNILTVQLLMTCLTIFTSIIGITQNYAIPREDGNLRYSLGFSFTTNLSQIVLFATLLYCYIENFKVSNTILLLLQIVNLLIYYITDSRTEILVFEGLFVIILLYRYIPNKIFNKIKDTVSKVFVRCYCFIPILSLLVVLLYANGGEFINKLNRLLSNRIAQTYEVIAEGNVEIFGSDIELIGYGIGDIMKYGNNIKSNYIDNEYLQMLVLYGIIITVSFIVLMNILLYALYKQRRYKELFMCAIYLLFGVLNPRIIDLMYSPILFMLIPYIMNLIKQKENVNGEDSK